MIYPDFDLRISLCTFTILLCNYATIVHSMSAVVSKRSKDREVLCSNQAGFELNFPPTSRPSSLSKAHTNKIKHDIQPNFLDIFIKT